MIIVAQIIGIFAMAANIAAYQFKSRRNIVLCHLIGSTLFAVNMFMLGALIGGLLNIVGMVRSVVYMKPERIKLPLGAVNGIFIFVYCVSYVLVFTVFGKEPTFINFLMEILPLIGTGAMTVGLSFNRAKAIRVCGFINSPCWLIYNIYNFSLGGILCEVFGLASIASAYIRHDMKSKGDNA